MMNFRTIKLNIISILNAGNLLLPLASRFEVVQAQRQNQSGDDVNRIKKVTVYYAGADVPENKGSVNGTSLTNPTFRIELCVNSKAIVTNPALPTTGKSAELVADDVMDEFIEQVWNILMAAPNMDLGMTLGQVSNRYIKNIDKSTINKDGSHAQLFAIMDLTCTTPELQPEQIGVDAYINETGLILNGDTVALQGLTIDNTPN